MAETKRQKGKWRPFAIYAALIAVSTISIYPFQLEAIQKLITQTGMELPFSPEVMGMISLLQPFILSLIALLLGHFLAGKVGLDSLLYAKNGQQELDSVKRSAKPFQVAAVCGLALGIFFVGFDFLLRPWLAFLGEVRPSLPGLVMGVLYGGIVEEILLRWGFMTLLIYLLTWKGTRRNPKVYWFAIFLSALLFALGHYGATQMLTEMTPLVWSRMLFLNGAGGLVFGWLYWKYHLEAAIFGHMLTHVGMFLANLVLFWVSA